MASTSANIDPMNNSSKRTLNDIIDSYFETDEADFNILSESNIDSLYYGIDDLHKCDVVKRNHNICSMHLNIRSLPDKFDKLKLLLSQLDNVNVNIDFILICETYLTERNHDLYHLPGYNFISRHRKQTKCGGVGMYISDKYNYIIRDDISLFVEHSFESVFVEVLINNAVNIIVGEIYRVPNSNRQLSIQYYEDIISKLQYENKEVIIGTDQNFDYLNSTCVHSKHLLETYFSAGFIPTITRPTRITHASAKLIDNIYVKCKQLGNNTVSCILTVDISYHFPVLLFVNNKHSKPNRKSTFTFRKFDNDSTNYIKRLLQATDWSTMHSLSVDEQSEFLSNKIHEYIDLCVPLKTVTIGHKYVIREKWMTRGLLKSSLNQNKLRSKISKNNNNISINEYKTYRNLYNRLIRIAKATHYSELIEQHRGNISKTWKILNKLLGKNLNKSNPQIFNINNIQTEDKSQISNAFCSYFTDIGNQYAASIGPSSKQFNEYLIGNCSKSLFLHPTDKRDIIRIINELKPKNSCGHDGISSKLVKDLKNEIALPLSIMINASIESGHVPDTMKLAKVIPIYKSKDKQMLNNYRPISLLPIFSKILEKVVYQMLFNFLNTNNALFSSQYGFRKNHSTINAVTELVSHVIKAMNRRENTISVFLHLSKAFDTVNHNILLRKPEFYGIRGIALEWFKHYLTGRKQYVLYNNTQSSKQYITCGVPQGSVLGPLLFLIYINDIPNCLKYSKSIVFADDTTIFASCKNMNTLYNNMNDDLSNLINWFKANMLSLNIAKTNYLLFPSSKLVNVGEDMKLYADADEIIRNECCKFLGIIIDDKLGWLDHINSINIKLSRSLYILNSVKKMLPNYRHLYFTMVQPYLTYGIILWGSTYQSYLKRTVILQKKAIRYMHKAHYNAHTKPLFYASNVLNINFTYLLEVSKFMHDYTRRTLPTPLLNFFSSNLNVHQHNTRQVGPT